jgi:hypothetical protein
MEPDRHHPLSLVLSCWFRQIGEPFRTVVGDQQ